MEEPENDLIPSESDSHKHDGESILGPLRTGRESPPDQMRPSSQTMDETDDVPEMEMNRKTPLPPIGSIDESDSDDNTESFTNTTSITHTESVTGSNTVKKDSRPRIMSFKRETDKAASPTRSDLTTPKSISFADRIPSAFEKEVRTITGIDGQKHTVISEECQTEWSWLEDMRHSQRKGSIGKVRGSSANKAKGKEVDSDDDDLDSELGGAVSEKSSQHAGGGASSSLSHHTKADSEPGSSDMGANSVIFPSKEDEYGIPILELSSDSDSSDDDSVPTYREDEDENMNRETLPSIGPPQILQYQRESDKTDIYVPSPGRRRKVRTGDNLDLVDYNEDKEVRELLKPPPGGILDGPCEFCGKNIYPFPSLEMQKKLPPEKIYCCDSYREFVQFTLTHPLQDQEKETQMIDVKPHAHHGSKMARKAAKERAAQRMREREMARQQALSVGSGGGGGGGGLVQAHVMQSGGKHGGHDRGHHGNQGGHGGGKVSHRASESQAQGYMSVTAVARQMKTINYQLSSQKCLEEGWTLRPPSPLRDLDADQDVYEPQPVAGPWAPGTARQSKEGEVILKYYPDGSKYLIICPDGTGNVFYPSGKVAISILSTEPGMFTYITQADDEDSTLLTVFEPNGNGVAYFSNGNLRVYLDKIGGTLLDIEGGKKRKWSWKDQEQHVHAPPIQPIRFALTRNLAVRIMGQDNITLTFSSNKQSCRFHVGSRLKLIAPQNIQVSQDIDEYMISRQTIRNRVETVFNKVSNLLKFSKSPKLHNLPQPPYLANRNLRMEKSRASKVKDAKDATPFVSVN